MRRHFCLLALASAGLLSAQPSLTGDWVNVFSLYDQKGYSRMALTQEGDKLTATTSAKSKLAGTIHGGKVELEGKNERGGDVKASGSIQGQEIRGTIHMDGDDLEWRAYRESPRPASAPAVHNFEPKEFHRFFSGAIPPALHIYPGDTVKTWTVDAGGVDAAGKRRSNGGNPETGPFYIEGALPGDVLAIKLNRVRLNRDSAISSAGIAATALNPYYNASLEKVKDFKSDWTLDRERGVARLKEPTDKLKNFTIPLRPMLGCIGVAPPGDMVYRSGFLGAFGGNMDYNEMREGVTIYLPVFKPGALLFVGDGHAAQGDGELTGNALETSMDVEFTVNLLRDGARGQNGPRAENEDYLMAMGIGGSLNEALQTSTTELSKWLARDYGLNPAEISAVLGSSMRYDIAEVVDPYVNVVAKISKKALIPLAKVPAR
jgi:acetamidase/formamidase